MAGVWRMMARRTAMIRAAIGTLVLLGLASCAETPKPQPASVPAPAPIAITPPAAPPVAASQPSGDWNELPVVEGGWIYDAGPRRARFVDDSGLERASLTCTALGRTMRIALAGQQEAPLTILTSVGVNEMRLVGGAVDVAVADIALDRIAFSRGRFGLRTGTLLVLPVQAEIGRVIEDCRG